MTLVDVLAGIAILAGTVLILAPLSADAHAAHARTRLRVDAHFALLDLAPPTTASGTLPVTQPPGCVLRWTTQPAQTAAGGRGGILPARCVVMQILASPDPTAAVLAERFVLRTGAGVNP